MLLRFRVRPVSFFQLAHIRGWHNQSLVSAGVARERLQTELLKRLATVEAAPAVATPVTGLAETPLSLRDVSPSQSFDARHRNSVGVGREPVLPGNISNAGSGRSTPAVAAASGSVTGAVADAATPRLLQHRASTPLNVASYGPPFPARRDSLQSNDSTPPAPRTAAEHPLTRGQPTMPPAAYSTRSPSRLASPAAPAGHGVAARASMLLQRPAGPEDCGPLQQQLKPEVDGMAHRHAELMQRLSLRPQTAASSHPGTPAPLPPSSAGGSWR